MVYPPAYPHDPIQAIADDVFLVRGAIRMNALMRISRNMVILRHGAELTLINPLRLDPAGERTLRELGAVRRVMRLGCFHGIDDPYYVDTFEAEFRAQPGGTVHPGPAIDQPLAEDAALPFAGARLFCFRGTPQPEAALLLEGPRLLLTTDAIQHYGDYRHNNLPARLVMPWIGFPRTTIVGPMWLQAMTPPGGSLEGEFRRLLEFDFDGLVAAHGSHLASGAHAAVTRAVERAFGTP
ncbi:MAG: hypothetical protein H6977_03530 [Gammaproteobacteria bacterium]|nr:hypothetical protein [Gammaproteobacteria bacterium]MCP5199058.1 hypothetical protein [Gammaproteobacteria bacterium]